MYTCPITMGMMSVSYSGDGADWLEPVFRARLMAKLRDRRPGVTDGEILEWIDSTLEFLSWCAMPETPPLGPCAEVDLVWHEMILFTSSYRDLCRRFGVAFIDHEPIEDHQPDSPSAAKTLSCVRALGIEPRDPTIWSSTRHSRCCGGHVLA